MHVLRITSLLACPVKCCTADFLHRFLVVSQSWIWCWYPGIDNSPLRLVARKWNLTHGQQWMSRRCTASVGGCQRVVGPLRLRCASVKHYSIPEWHQEWDVIFGCVYIADNCCLHTAVVGIFSKLFVIFLFLLRLQDFLFKEGNP